MAKGIFKTILAAAVVAGLNAVIKLIESDKKKGPSSSNDSDSEGLDFPLICPCCGNQMIYLGNNKWICSGCHNSAEREDPDDPEDIYFEYTEPNEYYQFDDDEDDDIPEGCRACGGDYPNCCDSCNLMSD